jgi:hypothetical protein
MSVTALAAAFSLAACSAASDLGPKSATQIGFTSNSSLAPSAAMIPVSSGGHTLDLTQVTLGVERIELKRALTNACDDDDALHDDDGDDREHTGAEDCAELKVGPTSVDLPLSGGVVTLPADALPAGTFRELELRLSQVELKGTFDGQSFDVMLPVNVHGEIELNTPLDVVDGRPTSITINVPVNDWLTNVDGSLIDPRTIANNSTLLDQLRSRIRASLRAFEDDDHDGHDDSGRHGPG